MEQIVKLKILEVLIFRNIKLQVVNKAIIIIIKYISENYLLKNKSFI